MSDGLRGCAKCGNDTTGRLCRSCSEQEMIDAEPWLDTDTRSADDPRAIIAALVDTPAAIGMSGWSLSQPAHVICNYCGALARNVEDIRHDDDCPVAGGIRWLSAHPHDDRFDAPKSSADDSDDGDYGYGRTHW